LLVESSCLFMFNSISLQEIIILTHLVVTVAMFAVIWFVQISHYPLLKYVPKDCFKEYERAHIYLVSFIVGPLMLMEFVTAGCLFFFSFDGLILYLIWIGFLLVIVNWLSTLLFQIPCHRKLEMGKDDMAISSLIRTNWIRTISWSLRAAIAISIIILIK